MSLCGGNATVQFIIWACYTCITTFWATVCKTIRPILSESVCLSVCLSVCRCVCDFGVLWPNGWMDQDATWHEGRPQPRRLSVRWGPSRLPSKGVKPPPKFLAHFYCGQTAGCIKMPLGMEVCLSPGDFVLDGDPALYPKRGGAPPNFRSTSIVTKRLHGSRCHFVRR